MLRRAIKPSKAANIMAEPIIFAIPKGRILSDAIPLLKAVGIEPEADFFNKESRALQFDTNRDDIKIIRVRAFDVATFVAHGAAHIGIVGSDVIEEFDYSELYAPVDLGIGGCRLSVASPKDLSKDMLPETKGIKPSHIRVATKYPNLTSRYYAAKGIQAECVKLNGAMELAPSLGLANHIVDLVESGKTLKENGLVENEVIMEISSCLIANRAAFKKQSNIVLGLVDAFRNLVNDDAAA